MAADRTAGDFGSKLREARERRGMSLREIAEETKISLTALEALERNDIRRLPGGLFSRSFVRSYAETVGLDPKAMVEEFVSSCSSDTVTAGHPPSRPDEIDSFESDQRAASTAVKLVGVSVPILGVLFYLGMSREPASVNSLPSNGPASVSLPVTSTPARQPLAVDVIAERACLLSVSLDGGALFDVPLAASDRRAFQATRELLLTVSDSSAVRVVINGTPSRPLSVSKSAGTVRITQDNFRDFAEAR